MEAQSGRTLDAEGEARAKAMSGGPPLSMLGRALRPAERLAIEKRLRAALRAEKTCALPATAFVSLYERGRVIGCVGHADFRAALTAARTDPRFGGPRGSPAATTVQLSLLVRGRVVSPASASASVVLGDEGMVAFDAAGAIRAVLLPDVAADGQRDGDAMLRALVEKAGATSIDAIARVMLVRRERFVVRPTRASGRARGAIDGAAAWLAARVDSDGAIDHGIDARSGRVHRTGPFHLGRAAIVIEALAAYGKHRAVVRRARGWLAVSIADALAGDGDGLPRGPAERAASLALACRAGVDFDAALRVLAHAAADAIAAVPWHAAQVATVLGAGAPSSVCAAALAPIDDDAFAPWSTLAADTLGDRHRAKRGRARLARAIAKRPPHAGGVALRSAPEVAMTALVVEVLASSPPHRAAARRAVAFLASQAFQREADVPAAMDPALALGAFPLAPHADFLRCDVTAHALLALLAARRAKLTSR